MKRPSLSLRRALLLPFLLTGLVLAGCEVDTQDEAEPGAVTSGATQLTNRVLDTLCDTEEFMALAESAVAALQPFGGETAPDSVLEFIAQPDLHHGAAHDCQRLIGPGVQEGAPMAELPLVALYVSRQRVQSGNFAQGLAVAALANYGPGSYEPLGIPEGLSCLWIQSTASGAWNAEIRVPRDSSCIRGELPPRPGSLVVSRKQIGTPPNDYPSTGRWMWDDSARQQFIGIRCANGWCEIGLPGFQATDTIPTSADVPGRWDGQLLAHPRPDGSLTLSGLFGRVGPGAENAVAADADSTRWAGGPPIDSLHVATMSFRGSDSAAWAAYSSKYVLGTDMSGSHPVWLGAMPDPPPTVRLLRSRNSTWTEARRSKFTHSGAGTVRWAWSESDEGLWVPCDAGCCNSTGFQ